MIPAQKLCPWTDSTLHGAEVEMAKVQIQTATSSFISWADSGGEEAFNTGLNWMWDIRRRMEDLLNLLCFCWHLFLKIQPWPSQRRRCSISNFGSRKPNQVSPLEVGEDPHWNNVSGTFFRSTWSAPKIWTGTYFWGRLGITRKQSGQVEVESRLLTFLLVFLTEMATMGLCGFLEDPAFPVRLCDKDAPPG